MSWPEADHLIAFHTKQDFDATYYVQQHFQLDCSNDEKPFKVKDLTDGCQLFTSDRTFRKLASQKTTLQVIINYMARMAASKKIRFVCLSC